MHVAARSIGILSTTQGIEDPYQLYLIATKNSIDDHLAFIPSGFKESSEELFVPNYMRKLFDLGSQIGSKRDHWQEYPPGFSG